MQEMQLPPARTCLEISLVERLIQFHPGRWGLSWLGTVIQHTAIIDYKNLLYMPTFIIARNKYCELPSLKNFGRPSFSWYVRVVLEEKQESFR